MSSESRERLAERQAVLVQSLTGRGDMPDGFEAGQIRSAAHALAAKRMRSAARACPALAEALGEGFAPAFASFAAETPLPEHGGPLADGRAFARVLSRRRLLPDSARLEAMGTDLRQRRRGLAVMAVLLREPRRLVLAARVPLLGERWLVIPLSLRRRPES